MCSTSMKLVNYFNENFPIKQIRGGMYNEEDIYSRIPSLIFRFTEDVDPKIYDELKKCVESFEGNLQWTVFQGFYGKKVKNYMISPKKIFEMKKQLFEQNKILSEKEYFSEEEYKYLCENGIEDIPALTDHIKTGFQFES